MTTALSHWSPLAECPIQARISPYADAVEHWLAGWLARYVPPEAGPGHDRLTGARFGRYASRLYPGAGEPELRALAALFTWFFLLDDHCDGPLRAAPAQIRVLRDDVLHLLLDGDADGPTQSGLPGPLREMLVDAWRLPRLRMPQGWRDRFVVTVTQHLDGAIREASNRAAGRAPSVAEYIELRRATSAAYVSYALIDFATGRSLPDALWHHPLLRQLAATGNDLLSWYNDVVSLERDRVGSGGHNLVLAVARERSVPLSVAQGLVVERWRRAMRRFVTLRATVPSFGPVLDPLVTDQLDGVANSVRGTIDWSTESGRYPAAAALPA